VTLHVLLLLLLLLLLLAMAVLLAGPMYHPSATFWFTLLITVTTPLTSCQ